ncbi:nucleotidyltransferase domain protein [Moorella thermoacetica]|uniref:Nucleotidyltransferase domain protein n=1 Tax=Neomoorella thermoacetica TaxID=1525 RepID=A0A1J5JE67_NEOTH|nr:nucleotidyltransferase domain-containing protein [Moorella thermoacetica]OIQ07822.1 nucleotidyltransferase domain protein [Moorella thermoacetica]
MTGKQVELTVREYIQLLRKNNIRVDRAILFGSYASGKARKDSDIDVAIISPDLGRDRIEEMVFLKKLAEQVDYDLSPRPGDFLSDEIIRKGKAIYTK